jgi:hypothetical protein
MVHRIEILRRNPTIKRMIPRMITTTPRGCGPGSPGVAAGILGARGAPQQDDTPGAAALHHIECGEHVRAARGAGMPR